MPIADTPERFLGLVVGDGQCVALVRQAAGLGPSSTWRQGARVLDAAVASGTIIATFGDDGRYANATDGSSHAAILLHEQEDGSIRCIDQWVGHPTAERVMRDKRGAGPAADDASRFYVVEVA